MPENKTDISSANFSETSEDSSASFASNINSNGEGIAVLTSEEIAKHWMEDALNSFNPSNMQYSIYLNEQSDDDAKITIEDIKKLAKNAQNDLNKILQINSLVRQKINEDDIIGRIYESIVDNINANVMISFDNLPQNYAKETKDEAEKLIKRFHKETNINQILSSSIPTVYTEGNCIKYLREKNGHYVIDVYPLGVAIVSNYNINGSPNILIDMGELTNSLQYTIEGMKNTPLFFNSISDEIKNNYPQEVYQSYVNNEPFAKLDIQRCGVNRFCNMNRKYGLTPVFKALKPTLILDAFDEADRINARAKAKKIIHQCLRKEVMGQDGTRKALEEMAYAHENLVKAFRNPTVLYTSPSFVEKIEYVEPKAEMSNVNIINQYRSRVAAALGVSFLNNDGKQTAGTANISIKQLIKTINKIAEQEEKILEQWYCLILQEHGIPLEYCPIPHILDAGLLDFDMRRDLSELLFSKFNCSYSTAYELVGLDVRDEVEKRRQEKELGYEDILSVRQTSYNNASNPVCTEGTPGSSDGA